MYNRVIDMGIDMVEGEVRDGALLIRLNATLLLTPDICTYT